MSEKTRATKETEITMKLNVYGTGKSEISTGIGFFDHMLEILSKHSFMDLTLKARGDTAVDSHHTVEDVGIVFGQCLDAELADPAGPGASRAGIKRFGSASLPLDEALAMVSIDLGNRSHLTFDANLPKLKLGEFDVEMTREFFQAVASNAKMTLHIKLLSGDNTHHCVEAIFKSFAKALAQALEKEPRLGGGVASTKGTL